MGLVEAINTSGSRRASSEWCSNQVREQVRLLEAREDAETEEKKEEDNGALQSAG